ncbi:AraC-like DNA-binding protein [Aquimarina sp. MAR_2010_214]|uniref:AraC family transcriptional regulator n=1 Tax=Aquimarina sp. MAR_2010_214 TaxID=1250026 RepID=UPI000C711451|nr:AraC family transcriptional regulator [Aquimarina sp. MAR_2010_214]PKV48140.1 AraC-like DNA-binding protein [Aquimarina sp. MAR_2010_214]
MNLPILDITQFHDTGSIENFYANDFATHLLNNQDIISHPHKHNFYLSVLFIEGTGVHEIDFESYQIKPGSVFLLRPGQTHFWKFTTKSKGYIIFHSKEFYEAISQNKNLSIFPFFFSNQNPPCIYLDKQTQALIEPLFISILKESRCNALLKKQKLVNLIDLIYIELSRLVLRDNFEDLINSKNLTMKLHKFEQLIEEKYKREKSAITYAETMNISVKHLNRICKETVGKTTTDLILERVILEAKRQILYSENNLTEIAWDLGYDDYSHFSKLFKQKNSMSPSQFQKMYLKKT